LIYLSINPSSIRYDTVAGWLVVLAGLHDATEHEDNNEKIDTFKLSLTKSKIKYYIELAEAQVIQYTSFHTGSYCKRFCTGSSMVTVSFAAALGSGVNTSKRA